MGDVETKRMPCMSKQMTKTMGMNLFIKFPQSHFVQNGFNSLWV